MKRFLMIQFLAALIFNYSDAQQTSTGDSVKSQDTVRKVFVIVENMPVFKEGGETGMLKFIHDNIKYPEQARENNIQGIVYVTFVIDSTGKVINAKILRGRGVGLDQEALRVVRMMPDWIPGSQNGYKVAVQFNVPVEFNLNNGTTSSTPRKMVFYNQGVEQLKQNNFESAVDLFSKAILEDKKYIDAYYNRGVAYIKLNKTNEACHDWNKCKDLGDTGVEQLIGKYCK